MEIQWESSECIQSLGSRWIIVRLPIPVQSEYEYKLIDLYLKQTEMHVTVEEAKTAAMEMQKNS